MDAKPMNLTLWSKYVDGARDLLLRLKDAGVLLETGVGKENKVYSNAIYELLLSNKDNIEKFLRGDMIGYRNHERKGTKLVKCEAYFFE